MLTLQGCTSSHTLSPLTAVYTTCTRQPSSGSPTWVSATAYLNTRVSSPGLSPIRVPSMRRSGRSFAHSPKRCEQGSRDTKRAPGTPCHVPTASQPTPTVSAAHGLQHTTNTRNYLQLLDRGQGLIRSRAGSYFRAQCMVVAESWITNTELSSRGWLQ
jgi:hypothetical protein